MKADYPLKKGEIIQLNPHATKNRMFAACLMVIDEVKSFGAQGYVQALGEMVFIPGLGQKAPMPGGLAYYRALWEEMEPTGGMVPFDVEFLGSTNNERQRSQEGFEIPSPT